MAVLVNLVYSIGWQPIEGCKVPDIRILGRGVDTKTQHENEEEKR